MLLRCTSVGCAVSTGSTRARSKNEISLRVGMCAARSLSSASAMVASARGCGCPAAVQILGGVRQVVEVAEGADDQRRVGLSQPPDGLLELLEAGRIVLAAVVDRRAADGLDEVEHLGAGLLANRVTQQPPEEPDVLAQRGVFVCR